MGKHLERMIDEDPIGATRVLLATPFWISDLDLQQLYERVHDDADGEGIGSVQVGFSCDGDA